MMRNMNHVLVVIVLFYIGACGAASRTDVLKDESEKKRGLSAADSGTSGKNYRQGATDTDNDPESLSTEGRKYFNAGVKAGASGDIAQAEQMLLQAAAIDIDAPQPYYNLGVVSERRGNDTKAIQFYQKSLRCKSDYPLGVSALSKMYIRKGNLNKALQLTRSAVSKAPGKIAILVLYADALIAAQKYDDAIGVAKKALRVDERSASAMLRIGKANLKMGRLELAGAVFNQVVAINPNLAEVYFLQGLLELKKGFKTLAVKRFEKALEINPFYPEALNNLATEFILAGNYKHAVSYLERAIAITPSWGLLYINYGNALRGMGRWQEASAVLNKARMLNPKSADVLFNMGILFYTAGDFGGINRIDRLKKAKEYFAKYKFEKGSELDANNEVRKYLKEIDTLIEREEVRRQRKKEADAREAERKKIRDNTAVAPSEQEGSDEGDDSENGGWDNDEGWE